MSSIAPSSCTCGIKPDKGLARLSRIKSSAIFSVAGLGYNFDLYMVARVNRPAKSNFRRKIEEKDFCNPLGTNYISCGLKGSRQEQFPSTAGHLRRRRPHGNAS